MAAERKNGAAAKTEADAPTAEATADEPFFVAPAASWDEAIAVLVTLTADVLRLLRGSAPRTIAAEQVDADLAKKVEPTLLTLRAYLQDYADRIDMLDEGDDRPRRAALTLRSLLEIVLDTSIPLPGDVAHARASKEDFDRVSGAAASVVRSDDAEQTWTVRNLTARPLSLRARNGTDWILPAYGFRTLENDPHVELDLGNEWARGEVEVSEPRAKTTAQYGLLGGIYVWVVVAAVIVGNVWGWWGWAVAGVALIVPVAVVFIAAKGERRERVRGFAAELPARLVQLGTFLVVLAVAVAVPAAVIVFGADLRDVIRHVASSDATRNEYLTLVSRSMQLALISIASLLPALLYYQFDRERLSTLREKFVHQIFRLDSSMRTLGAIDAKYGPLIDEIYGAERSGRYRKLLPGRRAPILVTTLLIMLGWLLVLLNPDVGLITSEEEIADLFEPRQTAPAFAFLGAYFFTLFALLRGYVRRDLRPKSYSDISVRIITVVILAWVLELVFVDDSETLMVLAFIAGIVPQAVLNVLREFWQRQLSRLARRRYGSGEQDDSDDAVAAALADPLPLTNLEGIDLYDRTRLASEGVTNIEALAHHDLVELMLQTRIPVPRLIDWTDQTILHLHLRAGDRATLQKYGIRTASDLLRARDCAEARNQLNEFLAILDGNQQGKPRRMQVILDAIEDEEWIESIRYWHSDGGGCA